MSAGGEESSNTFETTKTGLRDDDLVGWVSHVVDTYSANAS